MIRLVLTTIILFMTTTLAQDIGIDSSQNILSSAGDTTTMLDIMRDDTTEQNSDPLVYEIEVKDSTYIFDHGISISAAWAFGSTKMVDHWKRSQDQFRIDVRKVFDTIADSTSILQMVTLEVPTNQSISFPLTVGYLKRFNNRLALHFQASYAYQGKKTSFVMTEFVTTTDTSGRKEVTDTLELYRYKNHLQQHQAKIGVAVEYLLVPDYFSVDNVARIGIGAGVSYIPFSLYISNSKNESPVKDYNQSSYASASGMGIGWEFSVFGEKELSQTTAGRISLGYEGSFSSGYEGYQNLAPTIPDSTGNFTPASTATTSDGSHVFKLNFTLLIGSKKGVENSEE